MQSQTGPDYLALLTFRTALRRFERWSQTQARAAGLTAAQHQLLLSVKGHVDARGPTIGDVADYLLLRHHSAVELVDRAQAAGLVARERDGQDARVVRLHLTDAGEERLAQLSQLHLDELRHLAPMLSHLLVEQGADGPGGFGATGAVTSRVETHSPR